MLCADSASSANRDKSANARETDGPSRSAKDVCRADFVVIALSFLAPLAARADPQCLSAPYDNAETEDQRQIRSLVQALRPIITASASLNATLTNHRPLICLDDLEGGMDGFFSVEEMRISLRRGAAPEFLSLLLLHELRHLEQFAIGLCPTSGILSMDQHVFVLLALEADASAVTTLRVWQRMLEGDPVLWEVVVNWPSQSDIALRLGRMFLEGGDAAELAASAFEQWYHQDERVERYMSQSCSDYLESSTGHQTSPTHDLRAEEFLRRLCVLPDGTAYPCVAGDGLPTIRDQATE